MIKQFLGRLPKKPPKKSDAHSLVVSRSGDVASKELGSVKDATLASHGSPSISGVSNGNNFPQADYSEIYDGSADCGYEPLPSFKDVPSSEREVLFVRKLNQCCVVFDFTESMKDLREKDIKRQTLLEVVEYVNSATGKFTETLIQEIIKVVSVNLFRPLTTQCHQNKALEGYDMEEVEPLMDPSWPHLQYVYELLLRFVVSAEMDAKLAKRYIDHSFLLKLLDLFDSEDPREREYLKAVLHRIYGKFMVHRPFIRKSMNYIFFRFIFETEKFNGVAELLEVLGSIINGFALPLKEEHKSFLVHVLIPLHKPKCLPMYHNQLSYCITQFIEKDNKLADTIIRGLLKYWPVTNSSKEVMFLSELEEVLEATQQPEFQRCMVPLFHQIARCISSSNFQVAERALYLWNSAHIDTLIRQNRKAILPIILPALEKNGSGHWNQVVKNLTLNVRKLFNDADPDLFMICLANVHDSKVVEESMREKKEALWHRLEEIAAIKSQNT